MKTHLKKKVRANWKLASRDCIRLTPSAKAQNHQAQMLPNIREKMQYGFLSKKQR